MAETFLQRVAREKKLMRDVAATKPQPLPSLTTLNQVVPPAPGPEVPKSLMYGPTSTRLWNQDEAASDNPTPPSLPILNQMPSEPKKAVVSVAAPLPAPVIAAPAPVRAAPIEIPVSPAPPVETGPVVPQILPASEAPAPKGIDWNKIGDIAKTTGKTVLQVLQAAVAGRTAGLGGRAFNPATDTEAGIEAGKKQDTESQKGLLASQFDIQKKLRAIDQDFQSRQTQIAQELQTAKDIADRKFQQDRDTVGYEQRMKEIQAEATQRVKELGIQRQTTLDAERLRQGIPSGGGVLGAGDPAGLSSYFGGKS